MTNEDFIKNNLTERDIAKLLLFGTRPESKVIKDARKVFDYWTSHEFTKNSNCGERKTFSIWKFTIWHNNEKNTKENIGRSMIVSREVWLSMPHNRKYWNKAIEEYNKRWLKNE